MLDLMSNALIALGIGAGSGALGSSLGWLASGDDFIPRKFITGLITGIIAGLTVGFANVAALKDITSDIALLIMYGDIFGAGLAATLAVPKIAGAIATRPSPSLTTSDKTNTAQPKT